MSFLFSQRSDLAQILDHQPRCSYDQGSSEPYPDLQRHQEASLHPEAPGLWGQLLCPPEDFSAAQGVLGNEGNFPGRRDRRTQICLCFPGAEGLFPLTEAALVSLSCVSGWSCSSSWILWGDLGQGRDRDRDDLDVIKRPPPPPAVMGRQGIVVLTPPGRRLFPKVSRDPC